MRILIPVVSFKFLTGAELYVYELSRCLQARGHDVTVASGRIGGEITQRATRNGVKVIHFDEADATDAYDVLHVQEHFPTVWALTMYPDTPAIATVHSQWPCEDPAVDG